MTLNEIQTKGTLISDSFKHKQSHTRKLLWEFIGAICLSNQKRAMKEIAKIMVRNNFLYYLEDCCINDKNIETKIMATVTSKILFDIFINEKTENYNKIYIKRFKQFWDKLTQNQRVIKRMNEKPVIF